MSTIIKESNYVYYKNKQLPVIPEDILDIAKGIVYTITNIKNNKVYVGQTLSHNYFESSDTWVRTGIKDRWRRHVTDAKNNKNESQFYKDILEYSEDSFDTDIYKIVSLDNIHNLNIIEFNAINELNTLEPNGYNKDGWKNSVCFTKHLFLSHFKLNDKIPSLNTNTESRDRCQQKCVVQHKVLTEFVGKDIEEVDVRITNIKSIPDQVRLIVKIKGENDKHRTTWKINKDPANIIKYVINIAKELKEDAFIDPKALAIVETNNIEVDVYKYQKRLDESVKYNFTKISGMVTYYSSKDFYSYLILMSKDKGKDIRYSFGGKTIKVEDAYKQAVEFIDKLKQITTIKQIILRKPSEKSCPQQQATTKDANITFVEE